MPVTYEMKDFKLKLEFGNDLMQRPEDLVAALHKVAVEISQLGTISHRGCGNQIRDLNGNSVGEWRLTMRRQK